MSLRRRIAVAAALAVAAVAVAVGVIGYVSTRSHLIGETEGRAARSRRPRICAAAPPTGSTRARCRSARGRDTGAAALGTGIRHPRFRRRHRPDLAALAVTSSSSIPKGLTVPYLRRAGATPGRSASRGDRQACRSGSFFTTATVNGVHLEMLTVGDPFDHWAVQVALPLTSVDSVLNGLLLPYGLLIGWGRPARRVARLGDLPRGAGSDRTLPASHRGRNQRAGASAPSGRDRRQRAAAAGGQLQPDARCARASIEAQRNLVADASHELRTPIAALRSNIQIFLEVRAPASRGTQALQQSILAELDELTQVVAERGRARSRPGGRAPTAKPSSSTRSSTTPSDRAQRRAPKSSSTSISSRRWWTAFPTESAGQSPT